MKWLALALLLGAALRAPRLSDRPMHADEAVLADRFVTGAAYDPKEFHGPALGWATHPAAWIGGVKEASLRAVPVFFGLALIPAAYWVGSAFNARAAAIAAMLTAASPGLVYYSRYYIPESLLVFGSVWLCRVGFSLRPALAGVLFAVKETAAIVVLGFVAMGRAEARRRLKPAPLLVGIAVAIWFFPPTAWWHYLKRGLEGGLHAHPPYYYLQLLSGSGEIVFVLLGLTAVLQAKPLAVYAGTLTLVYSLLPYKTPWCALGFLHAWILLAAVRLAHVKPIVPIVLIALSAGQAWRLSQPLNTDSRNPWAYAPTLPDVHRIAALAPNMPLDIVTSKNWWPLPWYLRERKNVRWWTAPPERFGKPGIVLVSPDLEARVADTIYRSSDRLYVPVFDRPVFLRPGVEVRAFRPMD